MEKIKQTARTFLVTSFQGGIGKTFVASALAKELHKKTGKDVALLELNMLKPSTLVESLDDDVSLKSSFFDYYTGNWGAVGVNNLQNMFTYSDGIFYIPFSGVHKNETLRPCFNLNEGDITDSLTHFLKLMEMKQGYVVFDATFQCSALPVYLLSRTDVIGYVYSAHSPSPSFAKSFVAELAHDESLKNKLIWIKNYVEGRDDDARIFEKESIVPLCVDFEAGSMETTSKQMDQSISILADKMLSMPKSGVVPGEFISYDKEDVNAEMIEYRSKLRTEVVGSLEKRYGISDIELREIVEKKIAETISTNPPPASGGPNAEAEVKKYLIDEILGLGPLEDFMRDEDVDEIMVNGPDRIFVEKHGRLQLTVRKFNNADHVRTVIERILMPVGRTVNERTPYVDARLLDGSRVHAIIPPLSLTGPMITIRKFSRIPFTMDDLVSRFKSLTPEAAEFLKLCVRMKKNIIVSGGAGSGKTTMLNVLSNYILPTERVICIEDSAELRLNQLNLGRLEARQQGTEAKTQVTIRDLLRNALRMRPDRIIVGECRGAETIDMLQAMNTGHDGSLTTLHANSSKDAMARLETLVLMAGVDLPLRAIREQIASSVNIVIQSGRLTDGSRKVLEIVEITGLEDNVVKVAPIFTFNKKWIGDNGEVVGELLPTGNIPTFLQGVAERSGQDYSHLFRTKKSKTEDAEHEATKEALDTESESKSETSAEDRIEVAKEATETKQEIRSRENRENSNRNNDNRQRYFSKKRGGQR